MNTAGLSGSGRRSVIPYVHCVLYCLSLEELGAESSVCLSVLECIQRAPPFYISKEARTWPLGPRQVGPKRCSIR